MDRARIDVPVAMIFFNRADTLQKVFEQVRIARPSKLFLIQDGPRKGNKKDEEAILECRKVFEGKIDWECEVTRDFSEKNLGCGMRVYSGIRNAFEKVDRLIILEDDCVPGQSMFPFCAELLEKYKDDQRISHISGMNHLGTWDAGDADYFFCTTGTIWGWATWKRVWDNMDYQMTFQDDAYAARCYRSMYYNDYVKKVTIKMGETRKKQLAENGKLTAWTYQFRMNRILHSQIVIVPTKNLMCNIGVTGDATHATNSLERMPKGIRRIFFMKTFDLSFPLKHPAHVIVDNDYDRSVWRVMGESRQQKIGRKIESFYRRITHYEKGSIRGLIKSAKRMLHMK